MIRIAVDAMGGDDAPRHVIDGALAAARDVDLGVMLVGPTAWIDAELRRHAGVDRRRIRLVGPREVVTWTSRRRRRCGASRTPRSGSPPSGRARRGGRAVQRGTCRGDRDGGARRVRDAARRGSPRAGGHDPDTHALPSFIGSVEAGDVDRGQVDVIASAVPRQ